MTDKKLLDSLSIRHMKRDELDILVSWASNEGWNPGLYDADIFWNTDPQGFIAAEIDGELIGGGSIVSYEASYGFMGFFIIKSEFRRRGLGNALWFERKKRLKSRLHKQVSIGLDGVFHMQDYYARGGFKFTHRDIRFEGLGKSSSKDASIQPLSDISFALISEYDQLHFPANRDNFLKQWITQPKSASFGIMKENRLVGYGVIRQCETGYKIGPLFADNIDIAQKLYNALSSHAHNEPLFLDVPQNNPHAMELATNNHMKEVFGCAKMYYGDIPKLADNSIYGVTTFELG